MHTVQYIKDDELVRLWVDIVLFYYWSRMLIVILRLDQAKPEDTLNTNIEQEFIKDCFKSYASCIPVFGMVYESCWH